jgi:hypothetical protein
VTRFVFLETETKVLSSQHSIFTMKPNAISKSKLHSQFCRVASWCIL